MFSSNVRKDGISKKIALKYDLQYLRRSYVFFYQKYDNFFMDGKWKMIFLKKICYFQYICINVTMPYWLTLWIDILERVPIILCTFMETFTGVFIFSFPAKKNKE